VSKMGVVNGYGEEVKADSQRCRACGCWFFVKEADEEDGAVRRGSCVLNS
jgi:hypothetical protein